MNKIISCDYTGIADVINTTNAADIHCRTVIMEVMPLLRSTKCAIRATAFWFLRLLHFKLSASGIETPAYVLEAWARAATLTKLGGGGDADTIPLVKPRFWSQPGQLIIHQLGIYDVCCPSTGCIGDDDSVARRIGIVHAICPRGCVSSTIWRRTICEEFMVVSGMCEFWTADDHDDDGAHGRRVTCMAGDRLYNSNKQYLQFRNIGDYPVVMMAITTPPFDDTVKSASDFEREFRINTVDISGPFTTTDIPDPTVGRHVTKQSSPPDFVAPDQSECNYLVRGPRANCITATLKPHTVSAPQSHKSIDETWYFISGTGRMYLRNEYDNTVTKINTTPGTSVYIPCGNHFHFCNDGDDDQTAIITTLPQWEDDEGYTVPSII